MGFGKWDKAFKELDAKFDDPFEIMFGEDSKKKKKKKKKKDAIEGGSFKESLKAMSKKELAAMAEKMGIDLDFVDRQDKKAMRKAIMKAHKDAKLRDKAKSSIKMVAKGPKEEKTMGLQVVKDAPPYYFDEDTRDFVVRDADTTSDMNCFNAMKSLGRLRKEKRKDDGFGTLMHKLQQLIDRGMLDEKEDDPNIIDVDYTVVDDEPKAIEASTEDIKTEKTPAKKK